MNYHKLKNIKALFLDVDGVLTDGSIIYSDVGSETKVFNVRDGLGIRWLIKSGIMVGIVTGRKSDALHHRCENLGIDLIFDGIKDKASALEKILDRTGIKSEEIAYMGDDIVDIPLMKRVGVSIAVADAHEVVIKTADMVTAAKGGAGAVREVCELMLKAHNRWEAVLAEIL